MASGAYHNADATVSARDAVAVTISDVTAFPVTRSLYVGTGGDVVVRMAYTGNQATFKNASGVLPVQVDMVYASGTTASNILALY